MLKRFCLLNFIFSLLLISPPATAQSERELAREKQTTQTEKRIALVIGNGAYTKAKPLPNPPNDATDIAKTLKNLGFEVLSGINQNKREMETLIREFGRKLEASGGVGLFYYAGHGVQVNGENYLIPIEADIPEEDEVSYSAIPISLALTKMTTAKNELNIIILDACRNNPFLRSWRSYRDSGNSDGLAKISPPTGTLVLYATEPGKVASDGTGRNGLFTEVLLKQITKPNLEYDQMVRAVSADVWQKSNKKQLPWKEGNTLRDFYFVKVVTTETNTTKTNIEKEPKIPINNQTTQEKEAWGLVKSSRSIEDFENFLKKYPDSDFKEVAELKILNLKEVNFKTEQKKRWQELLMQDKVAVVTQETTDVLKKNPGDEIALRMRSAAYFIQGITHLFKSDANEVIRLLQNPKTANDFETLCYTNLILEKFDEALQNCNRAVEIFPQNVWTYYYRGNVFNSKREYDKAIADYNKAIEIDILFPWSYDRLALMYYATRNYDQAIKVLNKAVEMFPKNPQIYLARGNFYRARQNYENAFQDLNKAIEIDPKLYAAYFARGITLRIQEKYDEAIVDLSKAIEINPNLVIAYGNRGLIYKRKDNYDKAIADFSKIIEISPYDKFAFFQRGESYRLKNQNDKAITDFNKQIEINPQSSDSYIGRALILFERKDYTNAIADCNKAIEINPRHDWAYNARGWIHFNRKSYEQAIADYSKALNISPKYAIALRNRANAYEKIGDKDKAKADRLKAEELEKQVERTVAN